MMFYVGLDNPHAAGHFDRAFISVHRIAQRKSPFPVNTWIMDSGAFTTIMRHGGYPTGVEAYAEQIRRWAGNGALIAAVAQDNKCEPHMLTKTGLTVADHQRLTIERYEALRTCDVGGAYILPVLQGYAPNDYAEHVKRYGARLDQGAYVGVGSVCKRNGDPSAIRAVLVAIKRARPDLLLHGFGVKTTSLRDADVRDLLHSADSMAWSYAARRQGRNQHDWREAKAFEAKINSMPVQGVLFPAIGDLGEAA